MPVAVEEKVEVLVAPFAIEADHPRNSDLLLQSIVGMRLRSAFDPNKPATNYKTGETMVSPDQAQGLAGFPRVPGMQLFVNPKDLTYEVIDPLEKDEALGDRITVWMKRRTGINNDAKIRGVQKRSGKLDKHRMKTLCREMIQLVNAKEAKPVKGRGALPELDEVDELPGHYLLNPGSRVRTTQPRFEHQFDEWFERVAMTNSLDN